MRFKPISVKGSIIERRQSEMKITSSCSITLWGNEGNNRIEWDFSRHGGVRADSFFTYGLTALIENILSDETDGGNEGFYRTARWIPLRKYGMECPWLVKVALSRKNTLVETREIIRKTLPLQIRREPPRGTEEKYTTAVLTPREIKIARLLGKGFSQTQTGAILGLSVKTVNTHKQSLMRKLGFNNNREFQYWLLETAGNAV